MAHIQTFDNFEEMQGSIDRAVEAALKNTLPRQLEITYGDYFMRSWDDFLIFGYIPTTEELDAEERRLGATEEEIKEEHMTMNYSYARGFRFSRAYSVIVPEGELGDTHVSDMVPLTKEEFESARELNWDMEKVVHENWFAFAVARILA